ncbi:MAG: aldehyde dehydrogenase family protein [Acidimicrobiia bacterium]
MPVHGAASACCGAGKRTTPGNDGRRSRRSAPALLDAWALVLEAKADELTDVIVPRSQKPGAPRPTRCGSRSRACECTLVRGDVAATPGAPGRSRGATPPARRGGRGDAVEQPARTPRRQDRPRHRLRQRCGVQARTRRAASPRPRCSPRSPRRACRGLVGLVTGGADTAEVLVDEPLVGAVAVTGSIATGRAVAARCARRGVPLQAELGGNNAVVVLADADLDAIVGPLIAGAYSYAGQRCTALRRFVVIDDGVADRFEDLARAAIGALPVSDPTDPDVVVGPLISAGLARFRVAASSAARCGGLARRVWRADPRAALAREVRAHAARRRRPGEARLRGEGTFGPVTVLYVQRVDGALRGGQRRGAGPRRRGVLADPRPRRRLVDGLQAGIVQVGPGPVPVHADAGGWKASGLGPPERRRGTLPSSPTRRPSTARTPREPRAERTPHPRRSRGTPMGELFRRYWMPVSASLRARARRCARCGCSARTLALFRTDDGALGLVDARCPHRGASLAQGFVDDCGLRCPYHGWAFAGDGACTELPALEDRPGLRERAAVDAFAVQELGGLVFAYLGPAPAPVLPRYDLFVADGTLRDIGRAVVPCNWLQIMENSVDPVHLEWLHGRHLGRVRSAAGAPVPTRYSRRHVEIGFDEFEHGIVKRRVTEGGSRADDDWAVGHPLVFPNMVRVGAHRQHRFQIRVPVDDTHTLHWWYSAYFPAPGAPPVEQAEIPVYDVPFLDERGEFVVDFVDGGDIMAWVTQGPIADRTRELLVDTDRGIVLYRRMLLEQAEAVARGEEPLGTVHTDDEIVLPQERDKYGDGPAFLADAIQANHVRHSPLRDEIVALLAEPAR